VAHALALGRGDAGDVATTGLVTWALMKAAASSSALPPISPIIMMPSVCGSFWNSFSDVDEVRARDRVAADADAGRLAEAGVGGLLDTAS
jgi:hypothetical protein